MVQSTTSSRGDSIGGASILRALEPEHCESDPDDAFLRGVVEPLRLIEANRQEMHKNQLSSNIVPILIVVDALDECFAVTVGHRPGRRGSTTVAHLLESAVRSFPSWVKLVVSFRMEILDVPSPLQRLVHRLKLIQLDHDRNEEINHGQEQRAQNDIRMFIQAYMELTRMTSPLGLKGSVWKLEDKPGKWLPFGDTQQNDLMYAYEIGVEECTLFKGKHLFVANLTKNEMRKVKQNKVVHKICMEK
eukprot:10833128-Ditylum_brightwellii.AAC.1